MSDQTWCDERLALFRIYYDLTVDQCNAKNDFCLLDRSFKDVIQSYLISIEEMKKHFGVQDKINKFRIASINTLCLIEHECIVPRRKDRVLPVSFLINELYAINSSLGRLDYGLKAVSDRDDCANFIVILREMKKEIKEDRNLNNTTFIYRPSQVEALALFYRIFTNGSNEKTTDLKR